MYTLWRKKKSQRLVSYKVKKKTCLATCATGKYAIVVVLLSALSWLVMLVLLVWRSSSSRRRGGGVYKDFDAILIIDCTVCISVAIDDRVVMWGIDAGVVCFIRARFAVIGDDHAAIRK